MRDNDPTEEKPLGQTAADVPLKTLPTVELTDDQIQQAERIANARDRSYNPIGGGRVCGEQSRTEAHRTGVIGEIAYATRYNKQIDESVYTYGDGGSDFAAGPVTIDIKNTQTHMDRPALIVPADPEPTADIYFLLHQIDTQTVRIIGFATNATVTDREPVRRPGDTLNYMVPQEELRLPPDVYHHHPSVPSNHSPTA